MSQAHVELLKQFKKANKERKQKLAAKAGQTVEAYRQFLEAKVSYPYQASSPKESTIHIVNIVDASSSMNNRTEGRSKIDVANESVKADVELVTKGTPGVKYTYTLVKFSDWDDIRTLHYMTPGNKLGKIAPIRASGMTALYQAVGETLEQLKPALGDKVVVTICTDGGENDSRGKWRDYRSLREYIQTLEKKGYTITFIGTDYDTESIIRNLGVDRSNTVTYDGTALGLGQTMSLRTESLTTYSKGVASGADVSRGFYKKVGTL